MSSSMTKVGNWTVNIEVHLTRQGKEGWWLSSTWLLQSFSSFSSTSTSSSTIVILILILHFNTGVSDFLCVKIRQGKEGLWLSSTWLLPAQHFLHFRQHNEHPHLQLQNHHQNYCHPNPHVHFNTGVSSFAVTLNFFFRNHIVYLV